MANCQFTLVGSKHSSDIYMRVRTHAPLMVKLRLQLPVMLVLIPLLQALQVVRTKGPRSTLLYNLVGSANWEVLMMEASVSAGGGLSRNISLTDIPKPHTGEAAT